MKSKKSFQLFRFEVIGERIGAAIIALVSELPRFQLFRFEVIGELFAGFGVFATSVLIGVSNYSDLK